MLPVASRIPDSSLALRAVGEELADCLTGVSDQKERTVRSRAACIQALFALAFRSALPEASTAGLFDVASAALQVSQAFLSREPVFPSMLLAP